MKGILTSCAALIFLVSCNYSGKNSTADSTNQKTTKIFYKKPVTMTQALCSLGLEGELAKISPIVRSCQMSLELQDGRGVLFYCDPDSLVITKKDYDDMLHGRIITNRLSCGLSASRVRVNAIKICKR